MGALSGTSECTEPSAFQNPPGDVLGLLQVKEQSQVPLTLLPPEDAKSRAQGMYVSATAGAHVPWSLSSSQGQAGHHVSRREGRW